MAKYEKMYLISEEEYNLRGPLGFQLASYKTPDQKAEERNFKALGDQYENKAKQLYDIVLKYSRVSDRNEWYEKRDDTLPVAGTNIVNLITYCVKGTGGQPYGWTVFLEFLKKNKAIPRSLLVKKVRDTLSDPTIPTAALRSEPVSDPPTVTPALPVKPEPMSPQPIATTSDSKIPSPSFVKTPHKRSSRDVRQVKRQQKGKGILKLNQNGKGLKIYFK